MTVEVFILVGTVWHEGSDILGVYSTEEVARAAHKEHCEVESSLKTDPEYVWTCVEYHDSHTIERWTVDRDEPQTIQLDERRQ